MDVLPPPDDDASAEDGLDGEAYTLVDDKVRTYTSVSELSDDRFENCYVVNESEIEPDPRTIKEAQNSAKWPQWDEAIKAEQKAIEEMQTWEDIDPNLPPPKKYIRSKFVFKTKMKDAKIERYKARLVAMGFSQRAGIDYRETFAPVVRMTSLRVFCAVCAHLDLEIHHLDVSSAFLYGILEEDLRIVMKLPSVYETDGKPRFGRLRRGLYGLKQANAKWAERLGEVMRASNFKMLHSEPCLYVYNTDAGRLLVAVWVDDIFCGWDSRGLFDKFKADLGAQFKLKDLGPLEWALGIRFVRDREKRTISLNQEAYVHDIVKTFRMEEAQTCSTPQQPGVYLTNDMCATSEKDKQSMENVPYRQLVGKLMYLVNSRPDIAPAVRELCRFLANPGPQHWTAAKRVVRYIKGTAETKLTYDGTTDGQLSVYADADFANDPDTRRSVTGVVAMLCGGPVSWISKAQPTVSLSSTEAEYTALCEAGRETVWLRQLLTDMGMEQKRPTPLYEDNTNTIGLTKNPKNHGRNKHIDVKLHWLREREAAKHFNIQYVCTKRQIADIMTKPLGRQPFDELKKLMHIH